MSLAKTRSTSAERRAATRRARSAATRIDPQQSLSVSLAVDRLLSERTSEGSGEGRHAEPPVAASASMELTEAQQSLSVGLAVDRLLARRAFEESGGRRGRPTPLPQPDPDPEPILTVVPVRGMTCRSCEVRIQKFVSRLPNVEHVSASAVKGRVEIESTTEISFRTIERAIDKAGYEIGRTPWLEHDPEIWLTAGAGVLIVVVLAILTSVTGLTGLAGGAGDLANGGLLVALLLGLAAGVSTCAALVGGLVLALSASFQARRKADGLDDGDVAARMRPALVFMAGRIVGYGVFGAVLGALGASLAMPPQLTAVLMIGAAVVMTLVGTRLTGISPRVATWSPTLPMGLGQRLGLDGSGAGAYSDGRAATLGALSFFMPCGFTQAVQIYALSTGSPLFAGALLATFAIGTAPGLLALAGLPVVVPSKARPTLLRLVGVLVIGFAFVNASAGLRLSGISISLPSIATVAAALPAGTIGSDGAQTLSTTQQANGYSPSNVSIYAGVPTRWTIQSTSSASCATALVVPSLGISKRLKPGANEIDLPALPAGTVNYSCAMGMFGGQITVVERPATSPTSGTTGG